MDERANHDGGPTLTSRSVTRRAPDGAHITLSLPAEVGDIQWHGITRFAGPQFSRDLSFAPTGQYKVVASKLFPGGREEWFRRNGFDLVLYETEDRSDSCLVWVGPYNEATTFFGGPAPRREVLNRIVATLTFKDSKQGAFIKPVSAAGLSQYGTMLVGHSDEVTVLIRGAREGRHTLPEWRGMPEGDAEIWRRRLDLDEEPRQELTGTAFEWRYTLANPTAIVDVTLATKPWVARMDDSRAARTVEAVLSSLQPSWS